MVMIDDLNNEMLCEILCRLPCYRTALGYKTVSKRWCSLISDPLFVTQGFLTNRQVIQKEPPFIFLLTPNMWDNNSETTMVAPPCFQRTTLWSPILSLQFLPFHSKPVATFKDLILTFGVNPLTGLGVFFICNPLTKQLMALPPFENHKKKPVIWAALICLEQGRDFRVVAAHSEPKISKEPFILLINLFVYISETCQWKNIDVKVNLRSSRALGGGYQGVVCKGMVCIHDGSHYFGAFNPFDVADTFRGTLTAINLPFPLPETGFQFSESDGKLVAYKYRYITVAADPKGNLDEQYLLIREWPIWKLDLRRVENDEQVVVEWELISRLDALSCVQGSILPSQDVTSISGYCYDLKVVGVHPTNECLVYLISTTTRNQQLILFDTNSKSLEPLTTTIRPHVLFPTCNYKLDFPSWPTPIPIR